MINTNTDKSLLPFDVFDYTFVAGTFFVFVEISSFLLGRLNYIILIVVLILVYLYIFKFSKAAKYFLLNVLWFRKLTVFIAVFFFTFGLSTVYVDDILVMGLITPIVIFFGFFFNQMANSKMAKYIESIVDQSWWEEEL